ncbi:MAG: hypothetical protein WCL57_01920 [Chloroflexota bacterium]|jgi:hypothetical protein|nr:hypothetical protein [Chloroflexota bacterium]
MSNYSQTPAPNIRPIDWYSFNLGVIAAFAEMVGVGAKQLALSHPLMSAEADALWGEAVVIATRNGAKLFRENDLIVTDLFPAEVAAGKHVLLIYAGSTLDSYLALKKAKTAMVADGIYEGQPRRALAVAFGRLLSYPDDKIAIRLG